MLLAGVVQAWPTLESVVVPTHGDWQPRLPRPSRTFGHIEPDVLEPMERAPGSDRGRRYACAPPWQIEAHFDALTGLIDCS
jgi:hypothetical protein